MSLLKPERAATTHACTPSQHTSVTRRAQPRPCRHTPHHTVTSTACLYKASASSPSPLGSALVMRTCRVAACECRSVCSHHACVGVALHGQATPIAHAHVCLCTFEHAPRSITSICLASVCCQSSGISHASHWLNRYLTCPTVEFTHYSSLCRPADVV
jgi:hypothetical protein